MNTITRKQWIEALKSSKYKQTTKVLGSTEGHCCLGVFCEVAGFNKEQGSDGVYTYEMPDGDGWMSEQRTVLNWHQAEKLGLHTDSFCLPEHLSQELEVEDEITWQLEGLLMKLNDRGYTFEQIADLLIFDCWLRGIEQDAA